MCSGQPQIKHRSSRYNRAPAAPCLSACSLVETRLNAPSRRFHRVCSDYRNPTPTQPRFFTKQNGHLVRAGTLKNSALLTNLICGRGFGSVFHHHLAREKPLISGTFLVSGITQSM